MKEEEEDDMEGVEEEKEEEGVHRGRVGNARVSVVSSSVL